MPSGRWHSCSSRVHRALPVLPAGTDATALITEVAELAVSGRADTGTVCVTAPDVTDVTSLGVRASDGGSIYRPPHEDRYTTLDHLDTEEQILTTAGQAMPQAVTEAQARAAVTATDLNAEQAEAVVRMLTAATAATALVAPAGAGKSHTMAAFAGPVGTAHRPAGHRADHLHQRRAGTGRRGPRRVLQHRRVPRQGRRQRRAPPPRPGPRRRRARDRRGHPGQHRRPRHAPRSRPRRRRPGRPGRRHPAARLTRSRGNVPAPGRRSTRRRADRGPPVPGRVGSRRIHTPAGRGTRRDRRLRPARTDQGRRPRKPPASAQPPPGSPTTCAAKTRCCSPGPTRKPPTSPAGYRPGSSSTAPSPATGLPGTGAAGRREPGPPRGPDPRPAQHRDRRRRPEPHQPRHPQDQRHPR